MASNSQKIKHLYWRAGFGLTPKEWSEKKNNPISQEVDVLFAEAKNDKKRDINTKGTKKCFVRGGKNMSAKAKSTFQQRKITSRKLLMDVKSNWIKRMADSSHSSLLEKMCLFWHGHFACITNEAYLAEKQLLIIRQHALGNFKDLLVAISKDSAMIRFLNTNQNRKKHPNENFARELLELFTIGEGNYTEKDVQEGSRAFTGWNYDKSGKFIFVKRQHDNEDKTFFSRTGSFKGEDIINIILEKKETAVFIAQKIYNYFVNKKNNDNHILELAVILFDNNYEILPMMRTLFKSNWFYEEKHIGTKIKSPIELISGLIKTFQIEFRHDRNLIFLQRILGQELFHPPSVSGWEGGKYWIDNSTLLFRLNLLNYLLQEEEVFANVKSRPESTSFKKQTNRFRHSKVHLSQLKKYFSNKNIAHREELINYLLVPKVDLVDRKFENLTIESLLKKLASTPEYQLC